MPDPAERVEQGDPEFIVRIEGYKARFEVLKKLKAAGLRSSDADHRIDDIPDARSAAAEQFFVAVTAPSREDVDRCIAGEGPGATIIHEAPGRITRRHTKASGEPSE